MYIYLKGQLWVYVFHITSLFQFLPENKLLLLSSFSNSMFRNFIRYFFKWQFGFNVWSYSALGPTKWTTALKNLFRKYKLQVIGILHHQSDHCLCFLLQGLLSFLSAPLIGALSDVWGRKPFLLGTVFFTCFPIPLMRISPWWVTQPFIIMTAWVTYE